MLVYHCRDLIPISCVNYNFQSNLDFKKSWEVEPLVGGMLNNLLLLTPP